MNLSTTIAGFWTALRRRWLFRLGVMGLAIGLAGCGAFKLKVTHSPFPPAATEQPGIVWVQSFRDVRPVQDKRIIGILKDGTGRECGSIMDAQNRSVEAIWAQHLSDALQAAGYRTFVKGEPRIPTNPGAQANVVMEGVVREFWITATSGAVSRNVIQMTVVVQLRHPQTGDLLHEKLITYRGDQLARWKTAIQSAMDTVLAEAIRHFGSAEFAQSVAQGARRTVSRGPPFGRDDGV